MPVKAAGSHVLGNSKIRLTVSDGGNLESVENLPALEKYGFSADFFSVETDLGVFSNRATKPTHVSANERQVEFQYEFASPGASAKAIAYKSGMADSSVATAVY